MLVRCIVTAFTLILVAEFVPGISIDSPITALIAALILGVVNAIIRPVLVVLTFPVTILTLGLSLFLINASLFWLTASFINGFTVSGFLPALIGSIVVSIVSTVIHNKS